MLCSLFRVFGGDRIKGLMKVFQIEDLPLESKMLTDALTEAQRKVEAYFFGEPRPTVAAFSVSRTATTAVNGPMGPALTDAKASPAAWELILNLC